MKIQAVNARRWFDGVNTFVYGYGDHYLHTVGTLIGAADPYDVTHAWLREQGAVVDVVDVRRRADLHDGGKKREPLDPHVDTTVKVPKRGDDRILFVLRIAGYTITAWDTYQTTPNGSLAGRSLCGLRATKAGKTVFLTDQWSPSPMHSIDGIDAKEDACMWIAMAVGGGLEGPLYTEASARWVNEDGTVRTSARRAR